MFETAIDFLRQINLESAIYVFWYFFIFDLPRYTFGILSLALTDIVKLWRFLGPPGACPEFPVDTPISLLLVGHNEGAKLAHCIASVREQTMTDIEIVVVDDGSTDNMRREGHRLLREGLIHQFLSTGLRGGKASALNLGFGHCTRPFVISADIDTTFDRDAFHRVIQPLTDPRVGAVAGNLGVRNAWTSVLAGFQALQYFFSISLGRQFTSSIETLGIVSGAFGAFRRQAVQQVGAWDVGPGDDSNLTMKLRVAGWKIRFAQDAWAMTDVPTKFKKFFNQRMRWNRSIIRNRMRKFRSALNPFSSSFSILNVLSIVNVLFFQVFLSWSFVVYQVWVFYTFGENALLIIFSSNMIYLIEDIFTFMYLSVKFPQSRKFIIYVPTFFLFKDYILRLLRAMAYADELIFRRSYQDEFYPGKVRRQVFKF